MKKIIRELLDAAFAPFIMIGGLTAALALPIFMALLMVYTMFDKDIHRL